MLPVLQVLNAAETSEPPVYHDGHPGTQSLTLLHAGTRRQGVRGQHVVKGHGEDTVQGDRGRSRYGGQGLLPVGGEDHGASLLDDAVDAVPQGPAGFGVHAGCGLVL